MATYTNVQFIGYALTTAPAISKQLGFPSFVEGKYTGIEPATEDIDERIRMVMSAIGQAAACSSIDSSSATLKIFLLPEFALRGPQGAYDNAPPVGDYFNYFRGKFASSVTGAAWKDWLFVMGTIVDTVGYVRGNNPDLDHKALRREQVAIALANAYTLASADAASATVASQIQAAMNAFGDYCRHEPLYKVTDRCYVVAGGPPDRNSYPEGLSVQKKFMSNEDFVLNLYGKVCTEDDCAYPDITEVHGENKLTAFDDYCIFTVHGIKFGVEICLDHYESRIRTFRSPHSERVQIQLIPSCGMQITPASVIAGAGGYVFNCDGEYGAGTDAPAGTLWYPSNNAHAQLAQVVTPCEDGPPKQGAANAQLTAPSGALPVTGVPIVAPNASALYASGAGEVFVFSPLPVPPPAGEEQKAAEAVAAHG